MKDRSGVVVGRLFDVAEIGGGDPVAGRRILQKLFSRIRRGEKPPKGTIIKTPTMGAFISVERR